MEEKLKGFVFNENGVCTNPNEYEIFRGKRWIHGLKIETANDESGWYFGFDLSDFPKGIESGFGCGSPCMMGDGIDVFDSEAEAFRTALDYITETYTKRGLSSQIRKAIDEQQFFPRYRQLELK